MLIGAGPGNLLLSNSNINETQILCLLLTVVSMNEVICHISDEELVKGPKGTKRDIICMFYFNATKLNSVGGGSIFLLIIF